MAEVQSGDLVAALDEASLSRFHLRAVVASGMGFFTDAFGPNMTTFVLPSELYPVDMRTTGHGISAGIGKLGAFIGVFLFPVLQTSLGLRGTLLLTAGVAVAGFALTFVLPEPAGRSLEDIAISTPATSTRSLRIADQPSVP